MWSACEASLQRLAAAHRIIPPSPSPLLPTPPPFLKKKQNIFCTLPWMSGAGPKQVEGLLEKASVASPAKLWLLFSSAACSSPRQVQSAALQINERNSLKGAVEGARLLLFLFFWSPSNGLICSNFFFSLNKQKKVCLFVFFNPKAGQ